MRMRSKTKMSYKADGNKLRRELQNWTSRRSNRNNLRINLMRLRRSVTRVILRMDHRQLKSGLSTSGLLSSSRSRLDCLQSTCLFLLIQSINES
jgi:hypothetical protein